ncbi:hypothetical protein K488DRAFT_92376 [Vararia minispora EC-137]|uniref:Uncharacterized protein n=1 Tax=Vararia minispora EC-137 TaxID=1314806 RepID=A0ACB8Q4I3_9AGAM|nr:hypothetical protein K488DRAFT_92376 [Vararia minispora EC-137]
MPGQKGGVSRQHRAHNDTGAGGCTTDDEGELVGQNTVNGADGDDYKAPGRPPVIKDRAQRLWLDGKLEAYGMAKGARSKAVVSKFFKEETNRFLDKFGWSVDHFGGSEGKEREDARNSRDKLFSFTKGVFQVTPSPFAASDLLFPQKISGYLSRKFDGRGSLRTKNEFNSLMGAIFSTARPPARQKNVNIYRRERYMPEMQAEFATHWEGLGKERRFMLAEEEKFLMRKLESEPDDIRNSIQKIAEVSYSEDLKTYEAVQERGPETFEEAAEMMKILAPALQKLAEWLGNHDAFCSWFVAAPNADQGDLCCYHFTGGDAPLTGDPDLLRVTYDAWDANGFASFSNRIMQHAREGMPSAFIRLGAGMSSTSPNSGNESCTMPSTGHLPGDVVAPLPITSSVSVSTEISLSAAADTEDALTESANRLWIASPQELSGVGLGSTGPSPRASCQPAGLLLHSLTPGYADGIQKIQFPLRPVTPSASECGSEDAPFGFVQSESEDTHGAGGDNCDDDESGEGDNDNDNNDPPIHPYRRSLVFDAGERYYDDDLDGWATFPGDMTDHMVQMEGENALRIDKLMEMYWKDLDKEDDTTRISRWVSEQSKRRFFVKGTKQASWFNRHHQFIWRAMGSLPGDLDKIAVIDIHKSICSLEETWGWKASGAIALRH